MLFLVLPKRIVASEDENGVESMERFHMMSCAAAILVFQNKETAAILVYQAIPLGIKLYFYAKIVFCFRKPI